MDLVMVHGRDQQGKDRRELQTQWEAALAKGISNAGLSLPNNVNVVFPFYGDELARMVEELNAPLVTDVTTKGAAQDSREASFRGELIEELARNAGITDADIQAHYSGQPVQKGPLNWEWVQAILRALDRTPIGEASIDRFTRDVYVYLTNSSVRKVIDKIVADAITKDPCVIVAHSLGTVVTYNVLRTLGPQTNIKRFVTVGSPLGVNALRRLLVPPALAMPEGVSGWFNAYDDRDVVALRALDSRAFPITPLIQNKADVKNHTKNRHGIVGYLDDTEVARWICDALTT